MANRQQLSQRIIMAITALFLAVTLFVGQSTNIADSGGVGSGDPAATQFSNAYVSGGVGSGDPSGG